MPRRQQLTQEGIHRTITFRPDLDEKLALIAAQRSLPISMVVEELLDSAFARSKSSEGLTLDFPVGWGQSSLPVDYLVDCARKQLINKSAQRKASDTRDIHGKSS